MLTGEVSLTYLLALVLGFQGRRVESGAQGLPGGRSQPVHRGVRVACGVGRCVDLAAC